MYAGNMEMPCSRTARHLMIPHTYLPYDVTEDDLFEVLGAYGIYDIALNEWGADVYFDSIRGASEAEKRWIIEAFGPEMVGGPILNGSNMGHMGPMPPMSGMRPMGGMAPGASRVWGARPVPTHQPRLNQHGPSSNMRVSTSVDGSRTFQPIPTPIDMAASASSQDENTLMTGPCSLCQKCTSYLCGRCGIFYCSRECQKQSWPTHQTECNSKLPPLNFAGKRNVTEIEINSDQQQLQGRQSPQRHEQRSPTGKQSSTWRSRSNADTSQDNHSPKPQQSGSPAVKDESPQSSSFGRSNIRPGGFERRNEPRDENRRGEGYRQANGQGNGFGARQGQSNAQGRNFNRNRSDDGNGDRNRTYASKPSSGGDGDRSRTNASKPPSGDETSPRGLPSRAQDIPVATNVSPSTGQNGKSPTKRESTMALLMKNMKLASPGVETCSEPTGPAAPAPQVTSPIISDAFFKPDCINILKGSEVLITHVDENAVYLQAKGNINQLALLTKKLADHCALGKVLQRQPKKKEFVAAKFSADGNFYRAVVQSRVKNDLKELYVVQFVDFGNPESGLTNSDMMYLTKEIAEVPCMAVKVALKDVSEFSGEARSILSKYLADETILDFVDYGNDLAAGVTLFEKSGESVNVKLLKAMGKLKTSPAREPAKSPLAAMLAAAAPAAAAPAAAAPATAAPATAAPAAAAPAAAAPAPAAPAPAAPAPAAPAPAAAAPVVAEVAKATLAAKLLAVAAAAAPAPAVAPAPVPVVAVPAEAPVVAVPAEAPVVVAPAPVAAAAPAPVAAAAPAPVAAAAPLRKFTLEKHLKYVPFPSVGTTCSVLINFFHKEAGFFSACPLDLAALESVDTISTIITSHVANTPPYRPDEDELCVAKWSVDNTFYRAFCIARDVNDTYQVMFLEYGNTDTVPHADIRPYSEALAAFPALSSMCTLSDPPQLNELQKSKVQEMFKENWTVKATVVKIDDGACVLDIPEIRIALS